MISMMQVSTWWTKAALVITLSQLAQSSLAQPGDAQQTLPRPPVSAQTIEQKMTMVDKMLNQSPVAARVLTSQNEQARRHFTNARELMTHARTLSAGGQLRAADALLNEAIWEISRAQQLVPDPGSQQAGERARFAQLEDSVAALRRTAQIALPLPNSRQEEATAQAMASANTLLEQALVLARADKYIEANKQLDRALVLLLKDASTRLTGQTIVYDRRFANRREEFDFELANHRSFERLVPLAMIEFRPAAEALVLIERYVAQARELRERGEALVARDPLSAIKSVLEGTDSLRRALQAAGLVVPLTMPSQ
jgi:tetratricopeptide (TPR) repeat protein